MAQQQDDPPASPPVEPGEPPAEGEEALPAEGEEALPAEGEEAPPATPPAPAPSSNEPESEDASLLEAEEVDAEEALAAFEGYESLDEELAGDRIEGATAAPADADGEPAPVPPKERRLAAMRLEARVEAIVFAAQKPLKAQEIIDIMADPSVALEHVERTLDELVEFYETRSGGFKLHYLKRLGYQFQTSESAGPIMERMFASRPRPISRAALETLAIIAYRQPVTRAEVEFIRGVDAGSIFKTLLERELIKCVGRKEIVGRPMLFGTSDQFLTVFNLSSIKDLPPLESFQPSRDMVQAASDRLAEGTDDLVDVEQYIADNADGEYEGGDLAAEAAGEAESPQEAEGIAESANPGEHNDGTAQDSEVAGPVGGGEPAGGGELDQ